jgi:hypothetical protein
MATKQVPRQEVEEAVIVSGARKGALIRLPGGEPELTAAETAALDEVTEAARRLADSLRAAAAEADALLEDLRAVRAE